MHIDEYKHEGKIANHIRGKGGIAIKGFNRKKC